MLQGPDAGQVNWEALRGRSVLIEFWATWCGPCIAAIPHLNELSNKLESEPIEFISVSNEEEELVKSFLDRHSISGWIGLDTDRSMYAPYGIRGIPHTILIDANGIVRATTHPDHVTENALRDLIAGKPVDLPPKDRDADVFFAVGEVGPEPIFQVMIRPSIRTLGGRGFRSGRITMIAQLPETLRRTIMDQDLDSMSRVRVPRGSSAIVHRACDPTYSVDPGEPIPRAEISATQSKSMGPAAGAAPGTEVFLY